MKRKRPEGMSKREAKDAQNLRIEQRNLFESEHTPKVELFATAELSLWAYGVLPPELLPMAERLKARFGEGLIYVGPHKRRAR